MRSGATSASAPCSPARARPNAGVERMIAAYPQEEALPAELVLQDALVPRAALLRALGATQQARARVGRRTALDFGASVPSRGSSTLAWSRRGWRAGARTCWERRLRGGQIPGFEPTPVTVKRSDAMAGVITPYG